MYLSSGRGRKSGGARATGATPSLAPLFICLQGFATFAEDFIHSNTMEKIQRKLSKDNVVEEIAKYSLKNDRNFWLELSMLRCVLRFKTLQCEVECTPKDHQIIRPMKGQELRDQDDVKYVKNVYLKFFI